MARKGNSRHINTLSAPLYFGVHKKESKYVAKPNPGRFNLENSVPLSFIIKKIRGNEIARNIRKIIKSGIVLVNNKKITDLKYPIGFGDIIAIDKDVYKIDVEKHGRIDIKKIDKPDYNNMLYKVINKYKIKNGKIVVRLHDGSIIKADNNVKVNDSVLIDQNKNIKNILPLKEGAKCYVTSGIHVSKEGIIKEIKAGSIKSKASAIIETPNNEKFETLIKNIIVMG
jgi:small subunit ribosomal protein S4e